MPKKSTAAPRGPGQPRKYTDGLVTLLLRLPVDLARQLDDWARARGIKRTAAIQDAIGRLVRSKR
jgi:hypothetical protein